MYFYRPTVTISFSDSDVTANKLISKNGLSCLLCRPAVCHCGNVRLSVHHPASHDAVGVLKANSVIVDKKRQHAFSGC